MLCRDAMKLATPYLLSAFFVRTHCSLDAPAVCPSLHSDARRSIRVQVNTSTRKHTCVHTGARIVTRAPGAWGHGRAHEHAHARDGLRAQWVYLQEVPWLQDELLGERQSLLAAVRGHGKADDLFDGSRPSAHR